MRCMMHHNAMLWLSYNTSCFSRRLVLLFVPYYYIVLRVVMPKMGLIYVFNFLTLGLPQ
jgi:hypothetical protein